MYGERTSNRFSRFSFGRPLPLVRALGSAGAEVHVVSVTTGEGTETTES